MNPEDYSLTKLNKPDWENLTVMAKKHTPIIEAPATIGANEPFEVKIKIGGIDEVEHPNMLGHWINWVVLYANLRPVAQVFFYPEMTNGYVATVKVTLKKSASLIAQAYCNLHGIWEGKSHKIKTQ
jgi:superoxide reductase